MGRPGLRGQILVGAVLFVLAGCGAPAPGNPPASASRFQFDLADYKLSTDGFKTTAHRRYLADPMAFAEVPDQGLSTGRTAVVGSEVCRFYPNAQVTGSADLDQLGEGVPVPFGTILPITGIESKSDDQEHRGMFSFQDNWNWFYPTTFQEQEGLVFGADLYGTNDSNEDNRISAMLYNSEGAPTAFHPVLGYQVLPEDVRSRLAADRLAVQSVGNKEYSLWSSTADDFIALYRNHEADDYSRGKWNRKVPVFISTDLAAHALHLVFDRELQHVEQTALVPRVQDLTARLLAALENRQAAGEAHRTALNRAKLYLQTASALLALAPQAQIIEDKYGRQEVTWADVDQDEVLKAYPAEVAAEVAKMDAHRGLEPSAVLPFEEDYSQYVPRGHYTKNGILSAYFRTMMWYGRAPFLFAGEGLTLGNVELSRALVPVALVLVETLGADPDLSALWASVFDPISDLIGPSDDLSLLEVGPWWTAQKVTDFDAWVGDTANIDKLVVQAHQDLRPPKISGSSVWKQPSEGEEHKPPMQWRLFGQRFTWDSAIHHEVSPPRLMDRNMVRGLDVMKALGSQTAELLLAKSDYPTMPNLKPALDQMQATLAAQPVDFWRQNYYNLGLYLVKTQAQFEPGAGFYFTESPAWGQKAMLASHGTWAELRHDTILYVKQSAAERAGDGDFMPTFRTKPIPEPVHYLEPNVAFWQGATLAAHKLASTLDQYGLLDDEAAEKLPDLVKLLEACAQIAETEAADEPVAPEKLAFLVRLPAKLVHLVLIGLEPGDEMDEDQLKMAVIADVYTNLELGKVLEVGVGKPQRLYVALNDRQGGKRIAVGYTYSYYEFEQPLNDRLTDEAWKAQVYADPPEVASKAPFWSAGLALPPTLVTRY